MKIIGIKSEVEVENIRNKFNKQKKKIGHADTIIVMILWLLANALIMFGLDGIDILKAVVNYNSFNYILCGFGFLLCTGVLYLFIYFVNSYTYSELPCIVQYYDAIKDNKLISTELLWRDNTVHLVLNVEDTNGNLMSHNISGFQIVQDNSVEYTVVDLDNETITFALV